MFVIHFYPCFQTKMLCARSIKLKINPCNVSLSQAGVCRTDIVSGIYMELILVHIFDPSSPNLFFSKVFFVVCPQLFSPIQTLFFVSCNCNFVNWKELGKYMRIFSPRCKILHQVFLFFSLFLLSSRFFFLSFSVIFNPQFFLGCISLLFFWVIFPLSLRGMERKTEK